jgi:hypothetical protein
MAFGDFKFPDILNQFGLTFDNAPNLFADVPPLPVSEPVRQLLPANLRLAAIVRTEKAWSEGLIAPLLTDLWARYDGRIGLYSGCTFTADPAANLVGVCDFLLCRSPQQPDPSAPAVIVVESKRENTTEGLGQCVAGMVGAQRYNARAGSPADPIFGCVTFGQAWRFLQLAGTALTVDLTEYTITQADQLLGIFAHMIGPIPPRTAP